VPERHPEVVRPWGAATPTAERSELRGESRRVVYGGVEPVGHESGGLLDKRLRLGRWHEAGSPRQKNGKVEKLAEQRVPVVADLKRLDGAASFRLAAGNGRRALQTPPGEDLQPQQCGQDNRDSGSQGRTHPAAQHSDSPSGVIHYGYSSKGRFYPCQELPLLSRVGGRLLGGSGEYLSLIRQRKGARTDALSLADVKT